MYDSTDVARAAIKLAITSSRSAEEQLIKKFEEKDIRGIAVDVGGNIIDTIHIVIERAILASRRNGITSECHVDDGAIAGAAKDAIMQIAVKSSGLNGGGKIGICRHKEHLSVCIFMSIGLLHLNEVVIGLGHRSIPYNE